MRSAIPDNGAQHSSAHYCILCLLYSVKMHSYPVCGSFVQLALHSSICQPHSNQQAKKMKHALQSQASLYVTVPKHVCSVPHINSLAFSQICHAISSGPFLITDGFISNSTGLFLNLQATRNLSQQQTLSSLADTFSSAPCRHFQCLPS